MGGAGGLGGELRARPGLAGALEVVAVPEATLLLATLRLREIRIARRGKAVARVEGLPHAPFLMATRKAVGQGAAFTWRPSTVARGRATQRLRTGRVPKSFTGFGGLS